MSKSSVDTRTEIEEGRTRSSGMQLKPDFQQIEVRQHAGWAEVILNSGPNNYITGSMVEEMRLALECLELSTTSHCVVLASRAKRVFSRGLEIRSFAGLSLLDQMELVKRACSLLKAISVFPVPIVCSVNGACFGAGLELAMACDIRLASNTATFGAPEVLFGLVPGGGLTQRLLRQAGWGSAVRLLTSGVLIDAQEALRRGVLDEVVNSEQLPDDCARFAGRLARLPRTAIVAIKRAMLLGAEQPIGVAIDADLDALRRLLLERDAQRQVEPDESPSL